MFIVKLWVYTIALFAAITHAKKLFDAGTLSLFWRVNFYPLAVAFMVLDVLWNTVFGSVMFAEPPRWDMREVLFTGRCKRHKRHSTGWRQRLAAWWCARMEEFAPGHCGD